MTSGGFTAALLEVVPEFERATNHKVVTVFGASTGGAPDSIPVRLARGESERHQAEHEARRERLLTELVTLGIDPVLVSTTDEEEIYRAFLTWADERQFRRGRSW